MLSTSQILILLAALSAAVNISILFFRYTGKKEKFSRSPGYMIFLSAIMFIILIGIELTYFKYLSLFFFDFGWNSVLLTGTVFTLVLLPVIGFIPVRTIKAFFVPSQKSVIPKLPEVIQPVEQEIIAEEIMTIREEAVIEEISTEQIIPVSEDVIPPEVKVTKPEVSEPDKVKNDAGLTGVETLPVKIEKSTEEKAIVTEEHITEENKPLHTKKPPVKRTARPKTGPKNTIKKTTVHKPKKKST